jgi:hypothetical protein
MCNKKYDFKIFDWGFNAFKIFSISLSSFLSCFPASVNVFDCMYQRVLKGAMCVPTSNRSKMGALASYFSGHVETLQFDMEEMAGLGRYEIRRYGEYWIAQTKLSADEHRDSGFSRLAAYIGLFDAYEPENAANSKIPMTRPVFMYRQGNARFMEFVLPENNHPLPTNNVEVQPVPAMLYAVVDDVQATVHQGDSWSLVETEVAVIKKKLESQGYETDPVKPWKIAIYSMPLFRQFPARTQVLVPVKPRRFCSRCGLAVLDGCTK